MRRPHANGLLLIAALIWGTTFSIQQMAMEFVPAILFTGIRFALGALIVLPFALREARIKKIKEDWVYDRKVTPWLILTGSVLFTGALLQQIGINHTTVANAGFLTALYVPLTPLITFLVLRERPHPAIWPAAIACLGGAYLMSGAELDSMRVGDIWVLAGALFWAIHIILIGAMSQRLQAPLIVACIQFTVCSFLGISLGSFLESVSLQSLIAGFPYLLFCGVLSVGVGFTLQVIGQKYTPAADASIILSGETVFAAIAGIFILGETLTILEVQGCILIFSGVLAVEVLPLTLARIKKHNKKECE